MTNISGVSESVRQLINTQSFSLSCTNNVDSYLYNSAYAVSMTWNILLLPLSPGSSYSSFQPLKLQVSPSREKSPTFSHTPRAGPVALHGTYRMHPSIPALTTSYPNNHSCASLPAKLLSRIFGFFIFASSSIMPGT